MPSREKRRITQQKSKTREKETDKKTVAHPFLYIFSVIILVVIVVTFIGAPAISRQAGGGKISFGRYRGKSIDYFSGNYFSGQKDIFADQLRQGGENENFETQAYRVWRSAFDQTVFHIALLLEAEKNGLWVSEDRVDKTLIKSGPYQEDGKFSEERYRNTPSSERFATRKLFREQINHEQILQDILTLQRWSSKESLFFREMLDKQRRFSFVYYNFSDFPEKEIFAYGIKNKDRFKKIKLSRILIKSSQNEAEEIQKKLAGRVSSFEELARSHSKDLYAENGGNMGWRYFYDLEGDFDTVDSVERIFKLKEGELSPVMESRFGWVIYRCDSPVVELNFEGEASSPGAPEESLQTVRDYIMRYEKGMVEDYFLNKAEEFSIRAREAGFSAASGEKGLLPSSTEYFPLNYQGIFFMSPVRAKVEEINLSTATFNRDFFIETFSIKENEISDPVLLDDRVIVLKLDDERKMPEEEANFADDYYKYIAGQALEADLQAVLLDSDLLEDNFNSVFYQYIVPRQ